MALNIKNSEVERLAAEVAALTHVTKTEAIKVALSERQARVLDEQAIASRETLEWLQKEVWPEVPLGAKARLTRSEEAEALGLGPDGV